MVGAKCTSRDPHRRSVRKQRGQKAVDRSDRLPNGNYRHRHTNSASVRGWFREDVNNRVGIYGLFRRLIEHHAGVSVDVANHMHTSGDTRLGYRCQRTTPRKQKGASNLIILLSSKTELLTGGIADFRRNARPPLSYRFACRDPVCCQLARRIHLRIIGDHWLKSAACASCRATLGPKL